MKINIKGIKPIIKNFSEFARVSDRVMVDSMNRGLTAGITASLSKTKGMRKEWTGIKAQDLKRYTWKQQATRTRQNTKFTMVSRPINLADFSSKQGKKGVSYKLKGKQKQLKGSFKAKGMVFKRKSNKADSIMPHFTITPTYMFIGVEGDDIFIDRYFEVFNTRYAQQLDRWLG